MSNPLPDRLKASTPGLGEPDSSEIEARAIELAKIDGRDAFTDADLAQAESELSGLAQQPRAPEVSEGGSEEITSWDQPLEEGGHRVPRGLMEDDTSAAEQLIEDGLEEAEHDIRVAAAEENSDVLPDG